MAKQSYTLLEYLVALEKQIKDNNNKIKNVRDEINNVNSEINLKLKNHLSISVKDFGAVGDGINDDTTAIKQAFLSVNNSHHSTVFFPKGIYKITDTISVSNSDFLTVEGDATIEGDCYRLFGFSNCNYLNVKGLNLDGKSMCNRALSVWESKYCNITDVKIQNVGNSSINNTGGIELIGECSNSTIRNCKLFNIISNAIAFGISVEMNESEIQPQHCLIDNCLIDTVSPSSDADGIKFLMKNKPSYSTISNCTLLNCDKRALKLQGQFINVFNCYCEGKMSYSAIDFQNGRGSASDCTIKFTECAYLGIAICGRDVLLKNIKIYNTNNTTGNNGIKITPLSTDPSDTLGEIILDNIYLNDFDTPISASSGNITNIKNLKIVNCTIDKFTSTYPINIDPGITVEFLQLENLNVTEVPEVCYNILFNLTCNNCIIKNNRTLGIVTLPYNNSLREKSVMYIESNIDGYYIPYVQKGYLRTYKWDSNPMNIGGARGSVFNTSKVGDVCENTNITVITSPEGNYYVEKWICTAIPDETNPRGVWKEVRVNVN